MPTVSPVLNNSFAKLNIEFQVKDVTVLYTPVLSRSNLENAFVAACTPAEQEQTAFELLGDSQAAKNE